MISATFTIEEYAAIEKAANQTDRNISGVVRWATIKYLRDLALLPYPGKEEEQEQVDE
jgi:hypothetical protein